jgi:hypothetical protein
MIVAVSVMARDSQQLVVILIYEVECEDGGAVARLRIVHALVPRRTRRVKEFAQTRPEVLPDEVHEIGIVILFIESSLRFLRALTHH